MPSLRDRQPGAPLSRVLFYEFSRRVSAVIIRLFFGLRGFDSRNVPSTGAVLLASNHQSYLDPPSIAAVLKHRHLEFIARAGLFKYPAFAWVISWLNAVPIREDSGDSAAIKEVIRRLEMGRAVLIFPEGSRTLDGDIHDFKRGVSLLFKRVRCPVVPVAIAGAFEAWPRDGRPHPFGVQDVRVKFGTPIPFEELMKDGAEAGLERIRKEVVRLRAELEPQAAQPIASK